ncbi:MAG: VOC family protein [Pyrinomonadaceae bacterium]
MTNEFWLNLPVKEVGKAVEFFRAIGFAFNENFPQTENSACLQLGKKGLIVMLFDYETFAGFAQNAPPETGTEVLISFDAESREEVDKTAKLVENAGGTIFAAPANVQGWMYGFGFVDLDGHRWNMAYMDFSKMPNPQN